MASGVLVFAELSGTEPKKSSYELIGAAKTIVEAQGGSTCAAVLGPDVAAAAAALGKYGLTKIFTVEDAALSHYSPDGFSLALEAVVKAADPEVILLASSAMGKDLGPALAARLGTGIVSDAIEISTADGSLKFSRPVYAGKTRITVEAVTTPVVVSLRPNVFAPAAESGDAAEVSAVEVDLTGDAIRAVVDEVLAPEVRTVDLTEADVIVSGGRGMKGPDHFNLIEELAEALGGVTGASRAVVDAGWRPHAEQVGQTGKTVSPKLYVACGISGAIQHLAGMSSSKCIVAINKDPEAPIFKVADYGIVGDVFEILPKLIEAVREKKSGSA